MRIAMYSDQFFPELSGITDSMITAGEALRAAGHEVLYVAPRYAKRNYAAAAPKGDATDSAFAARSKLPVLRMPSVGVLLGAASNQARFAFPIGTTLSAVRRFKPDVIHTHQPFGVGIEALIASRLLRVPLIGTNHTPIEQYVPAWLASPARRFYAWYYDRCCFTSTPYPGLIRDMRAKGFAAPAEAVPNPVALDAFTPAPDAARQAAKEALGLAGAVVLYAGRLSPEKHVDVVIRAVAELAREGAPATLVLAGHGSARPRLEALARELGVERHVRFLGFVDPAALPTVYRAADAFAIMSTAETQSLVLMQAYAAGLPAVVADAGALSDYAPTEASFTVSTGDAPALAARLRELLADAALRARMGTAARAYAAQFAPATIAERWHSIYAKASR